MSKTLQFKRYPTSTLSSTTGADGEIIVDTTLKTLTVHDGVTPGGSTLISNNNSANLAQIGITGNIWDVGHIVVGDVITSANIINVVNFNSNQTQTSFAKTLNIVDANAGFKVVRTNGNPSIELSQWDNTLSNEIATYDLQINNNIFQLRSKQINYTGTLTNNVIAQFTANNGTGTQSFSSITGAMIVRGGVGVNGNLNASGWVYANTALGFSTGTGNVAVQTTNKTNTVTLNNPTGQITLNSSSLNAQTSNTFILLNTFIGANDFILLNHFSGGTIGAYHLASNTSFGQANVTIRNISTTTLTEAPVIQYVVIKAAAS
jgi:Major tropism determinant N-terminal domain